MFAAVRALTYARAAAAVALVVVIFADLSDIVQLPLVATSSQLALKALYQTDVTPLVLMSFNALKRSVAFESTQNEPSAT